MIAGVQLSWEIDGWIIAVGVLCAVAAALPGNFLVLRRVSMLGDAISHAVLPGLAAAFLLSGSRSSLPMFIGAVAVGVLTAFFTEWIRRVGRVDEGASMGVVFTSLFAVGLVMIVRAADHVDLDPGCVLYGALEFTPLDKISVAGFDIPRAAAMLAVVASINAAFILLFYKELKLSSFDPALATTAGFNSAAIHYALMILVAVTAVASFESVGNILVVAMFVVPPATAYLLTDRLPVMIALSVVLAAASAVIGHLGAVYVPAAVGYPSTSTAGMIAVATGLGLTAAIAFAPRHGILVKLVRQRLLAMRILADDVVGYLYRADEKGTGPVGISELKANLLADRISLSLVAWWLRLRGTIAAEVGGYRLSAKGEARGETLVRSHRLWEQYLASQAGVEAERLHAQAERFEHFTDRTMRARLDRETGIPEIDPHGSPIPAEKPRAR